MALIKFAVIKNRNALEKYYEYVDAIMEEIVNKGYADSFEVYTEEEYPTAYFCEVKKENIDLQVIFEFETYKDVKQLAINIIAENYELDPDDIYFENLKMFIKSYITRDWEKIVWLYDDDAYVLSKDLYSRFYVTENSIRRFIHEFMFKTLGLEWWDIVSDQSIKDKYKARFKGYKTVVPGFSNVDDHLLSIDVGDLLKILTIKRKSWDSTYDADIESLLVGVTEGKENKIIERLKKQLVVKEDFWDKYFKSYFDDDFIKEFGDFEANRNHVAHNKILDRTAYKSIRRSIDKMDDYMRKALEKLYKEKKSLEQLQVEAQEYEELLLEAKQNDAGVNIRNTSSIIEEFEDVIREKYVDIVEALRFREDIELSEIYFDSNKYSGLLFSVESKVTKDKLDFYYAMDINDDEGAESTVTITCNQESFALEENEDTNGFYVSISYTNGEVEFDEEQGYYLPISEDGIIVSDIENFVETMIDFINTELESLKDYIESIRYETVKDGGELPVASGVYCDECCEEYICIDDNLAEVGTCLNCGAHNEISECERCGQYFNDYDDEEVKLCDNCKEQIESQ